MVVFVAPEYTVAVTGAGVLARIRDHLVLIRQNSHRDCRRGVVRVDLGTRRSGERVVN
jgi:hypothetical protein